MRVFVLILIFIIEYLKYCLGLNLFFEEKMKRLWPVFIGLAVYILFMIYKGLPEYEILLIMYIIVLVVMVLSMESKINYRISHLLISIFIITCLDELTKIPVSYILRSYKGSISTANLEYIICSMISCCVLIIVLLAKQSNLLSHRKIISFIRKWIYFFVAIMGIFILITIAGLNLANEYISDKKISFIIALVSIISGFSVMAIGAFMVYMKSANEKMEQLIESERKLKDMYIKYYQEQLAREEDTRKYRHDLSKHLVCLSELANNKKIEMVKDYIEKMQAQMNYIQKKSYYVGNEILDAILNYYLPMIEKDIRVHIIGSCTEKIIIDNVDLCTIFSNLIQNAIEELTKKSTSEKYLDIIIQYGKEYFLIELRNSISSENLNRYEKFFNTKKPDQKNHGFGLRNVKDIIEKNKGVFEIRRERNEVIAKVVFEMKKLTA